MMHEMLGTLGWEMVGTGISDSRGIFYFQIIVIINR